MTITISITLHNKSFVDKFAAEPKTPDYIFADRAFQLALLFAQTTFMSQHGYKPNGDELGHLLQDIEYSYKKEC